MRTRPARRPELRRHRPSAVVGSLALAATLVAACNDDGRTLRPARPDQDASVSTTIAPSTVAPGFGTVAPTSPDFPDAADASADLPMVTGPLDSVDLPIVPDDPPEAVLSGPFVQGGAIDPRSTCDGEDVSPALSWTAAPEGTVEIAITMTDTDAPGFVHWAVAGLDPTLTSVSEGAVPEGAIVALNSTGSPGYTGPCPPAGGGLHRYVVSVHFLATATEIESGALGEDLLAVVEDATFSGASLVGTYARP